jgi:hypothetical protein
MRDNIQKSTQRRSARRDAFLRLFLQFHETVVGDQLWKQMAQMLRHMLQIEMPCISIAIWVCKCRKQSWR